MKMGLFMGLPGSQIGRPELVQNGTFDGGSVTGWTGINATASAPSNQLVLTVTANGSSALHTPISTIAGVTYSLTFDFISETLSVAPAHLYVGTSPGGGQLRQVSSLSPNSYSTTFTATGTTSYVSAVTGGTALAGETATYDNISVRRL